MTGSSRRARGFTLIEMTVVIAVLAVIGAVAAPSLRSFASGQRVKSASFDLTADLLYARSEALKRNASVSMTPATGGWSAGWTVASGGTTLLAREASNEALLFDDAPDSIVFNANGRVSMPAANVRITLHSSNDANQQRCIGLDLSGRASAKLGACT